MFVQHNSTMRGTANLLISVAWTAIVSFTMTVRATPITALNLATFEGKEEPTVLYHPSNASFTNDSYVNMTDQGGGVMRFTLRYHPDQDWWDGDRATTNTDRQR